MLYNSADENFVVGAKVNAVSLIFCFVFLFLSISRSFILKRSYTMTELSIIFHRSCLEVFALWKSRIFHLTNKYASSNSEVGHMMKAPSVFITKVQALNLTRIRKMVWTVYVYLSYYSNVSKSYFLLDSLFKALPLKFRFRSVKTFLWSINKLCFKWTLLKYVIGRD